MRIIWCARTGISVSADRHAHSRTFHLEHVGAKVLVWDVRCC